MQKTSLSYEYIEQAKNSWILWMEHTPAGALVTEDTTVGALVT